MNARFDDRMKKALAANGMDDADPFAPNEEESLFRQAMGLFQGRRKRLSIMVAIVMTALVIVAGYSAWRFFQVEATRDLIMYGLIFFFAMMSVSMMKIWSWMQMDKYTILREVKRLELQIAHLANQNRANP